MSWCWPSRPDEVRRRCFHSRVKAEAFRARLEQGFASSTAAAYEVAACPDLLVRIDARQCSPWVEVA